MNFEWAPQARFGQTNGVSLNEQVDAAVVADQMQQLQEASKDGKIGPRQLWKANKDKDAVGHRLFEWNNRTAADKYRDEQARLVMRSVVVTVTDDEGQDRKVRAFSKVSTGSENNYRETVKAMAEPDHRDYILQQALNALRHWRKKWSTLNDLADVLEHVDKAIDALRKEAASV